ncbi:hypothetical protein POTOM_061246 [Populus tomentosa]|uniref:Uncharacterized protein n=1 Tax=Populus tomentosa TaxID=118781 RepID=A0A8X7XMA5_POPTO|nr:hypothetical protein POTOM_061246 [Populus tomentosa]
MLIGRHDIEKLMRFDPSSAHLPNSVGESNMVNSASDAESLEIESELNELLFKSASYQTVPSLLTGKVDIVIELY